MPSLLELKQLLLRRLKVTILKFSLMYLINDVHAAASGIQLPLPLKPAASSNLFIYRLQEVTGHCWYIEPRNREKVLDSLTTFFMST